MIAITWQTAEPGRLEAWLRTVLKIAAARADDVSQGPDGTDIRLANARIRVERGQSRLDRLAVAAAVDPANASGARLGETAAGEARLIAIGVATVDTERYAAERGWRTRPLPADPILGAFAALAENADPTPFLLLEPNTEGRLAATLARHGEGPAVLYAALPAGSSDGARTAAADIGPVSAVLDGPFGPEWAPLGRPAWGPHVVIVSGGDIGASGRSGMGTIRG